MSAALNDAANVALEAIVAVHRAFGAPGNFGYSTKEGKALFSLYRARDELLSAVNQSETAKPNSVDQNNQPK